MNEVIINVEHVDKIYKLYDKPTDRLKEALHLSNQKLSKEHYALNDISFQVNKGEAVGIIGTNGSGKSTILKIITGVLNPSAGNISINGRISALLELGAGFNMEYTGIENVYLQGTMAGYSKEEVDAKIDEILQFADIGDYVYQPCKTYSSGMFVRLAFAVAINIEPEILIVDEALSVGDVFFQNKCYRKFEEFKAQGKTILMVSHDLGSIKKYCDRVILLDKGIKKAEGVPKDMVDLYKKILVGADEQSKEVADNGSAALVSDSYMWKSAFSLNPDVDEYGNGKATIIDFAIIDDEENLTNTLIKGKKFTICSKVKFNEDISNPIFTYTIKTIKGTDITGTNTMFEKKNVSLAKQGEVYVASFTQEMNLQGGEYLLSISCTGFVENDLVVYHRLYDVMNITVISDKNTVGYYDMNSFVEVKKI